jgi:PDZ domain
VIFVENDSGCFVTDVHQNGSAARSGGVEVGDQLAAINGSSSFNLKVEDICELITKAHNPRCIELVFLRYIGPFMPRRSPLKSSGPAKGDLGMTDGNIAAASTQQTTAPPKERPRRRGFRIFWRGKKKAL